MTTAEPAWSTGLVAPTPTETLVNVLLGPRPGAPALPAATGRGVRAALDEAILPALARPPCLVSFSGGRDSSAVLASAIDTALRHGLQPPVAATMHFPDAPETDEAAWQQLVLDHLKVTEQTMVPLRGELELLGPLATSLLRQVGLHWPVNVFMHGPLLEHARGGSLLTGVGGDELFGTRASRHVLVARGGERPRLRDLAATALAWAPRPIRRAVWRRRNPPAPWLTTAGARVAGRAMAQDETRYPHRWDHAVRHWYGSRAHAGVRSLAAYAQSFDVQLVSPFLAPPVLAEVIVAGGPTGFTSRDAAMHALFGDLLPPALVVRATKAGFVRPLWGSVTRGFVTSWNGEGVDRHLVDVDALRAEWSSDRPHFGSSLLLHAAWLHGDRR